MKIKGFITVLFILDLVTTIHFTLLVNGMFPSGDIFQVSFHLWTACPLGKFKKRIAIVFFKTWEFVCHWGSKPTTVALQSSALLTKFMLQSEMEYNNLSFLHPCTDQTIVLEAPISTDKFSISISLYFIKNKLREFVKRPLDAYSPWWSFWLFS